MPEDKEAKSPRKKKCLFVNHQDKLGRTALHTAVAFGNRIAVETLLYLGCNPHAKDFWGQRPLDMCFGNETLG
jgi:ankyrin repeat protein